MKKLIFGLMCMTAFSTYAADIGLSVGKDQKFKKDVTSVSIGTEFVGLKVSTDITRASDTYYSVGNSVGKSFKLFFLEAQPYVGVSYMKADNSKLKNGFVGLTGFELSLPLNKHVALTSDISRRWDLDAKTDYKGTVVMVGLKGSF